MRTARLHRREWTVAIELLAMVDYVTDTLKTSRLKKVDMIDMTVANATSKMLPTCRAHPLERPAAAPGG